MFVVTQSNNFTAVLSYDHTSHHPKERMFSELKLYEDYKLFISIAKENESVIHDMLDMTKCEVTLVPTEVAQNRKRRWSKKFPILITCKKPRLKPMRCSKVYLFSPTARDKEDWFRRLRSAADGITTEQLIQRQEEFFKYMQKYFPEGMLRNLSLVPSSGSRGHGSGRSSSINRSSSHSSRKAAHQRDLTNTRVQFSKGMDTDEFSDDAEVLGGVNITRMERRNSPNISLNRRPGATHISSSSASPDKSLTPPPVRRRSPVSRHSHSPMRSRRSDDFEIVDYSQYQSQPLPQPLPQPRQNSIDQPPHLPLAGSVDLWLNSVAARLCWDVWHEQRWKDWIMTRIQKKLIKVKTPSFMEKLQLMDIDVGTDMPVVKRLVGGPRLDLRGLWIYLEVTYQGKFVMTIKTKMKLNNKGEGVDQQQQQRGEKEGKQMTSMTSRSKDSR